MVCSVNAVVALVCEAGPFKSTVILIAYPRDVSEVQSMVGGAPRKSERAHPVIRMSRLTQSELFRGSLAARQISDLLPAPPEGSNFHSLILVHSARYRACIKASLYGWSPK